MFHMSLFPLLLLYFKCQSEETRIWINKKFMWMSQENDFTCAFILVSLVSLTLFLLRSFLFDFQAKENKLWINKEFYWRSTRKHQGETGSWRYISPDTLACANLSLRRAYNNFTYFKNYDVPLGHIQCTKSCFEHVSNVSSFVPLPLGQVSFTHLLDTVFTVFVEPTCHVENTRKISDLCTC